MTTEQKVNQLTGPRTETADKDLEPPTKAGWKILEDSRICDRNCWENLKNLKLELDAETTDQPASVESSGDACVYEGAEVLRHCNQYSEPDVFRDREETDIQE